MYNVFEIYYWLCVVCVVYFLGFEIYWHLKQRRINKKKESKTITHNN